MEKTFVYNWFPLHLQERGIKEFSNLFELKTRYELCQWEEDKETEEYISYYGEFFKSTFTCLVFAVPNAQPVQLQYAEKLKELEQKVIFDKSFFTDEAAFKNSINEMHELAPGKYVYVIFKSAGDDYTPIYIDQSNVWHRLDVFPLTEGPVTEKPCVWKSKEFGIGVEKPIELERSYSRIDYTIELEGRHPKTLNTQGMRVTMNLEGYFMKLRIELMYHRQASIIKDLFNSDLKVVHSIVTIKEP